MYATLEADIRNGKIVPCEPALLPRSGHVLVTILPEPQHKLQWADIRKHVGWLKGHVDGVSWQRKIRAEWD